MKYFYKALDWVKGKRFTVWRDNDVCPYSDISCGAVFMDEVEATGREKGKEMKVRYKFTLVEDEQGGYRCEVRDNGKTIHQTKRFASADNAVHCVRLYLIDVLGLTQGQCEQAPRGE